MKYPNRWTVGEWTFYQVIDHGFGGEHEDKPLYGFTTDKPLHAGPFEPPKLGELYPSLEHAMVAAVGEKYSGRRGAGGTGVGTAADWFMRMIGADQLVPVGAEGRRAMAAALANDAPDPTGAARRIETLLRDKGYTLAKVNTGS